MAMVKEEASALLGWSDQGGQGPSTPQQVGSGTKCSSTDARGFKKEARCPDLHM